MVVILMYKQNSTNSITQVFTEFGTTGFTQWGSYIAKFSKTCYVDKFRTISQIFYSEFCEIFHKNSLAQYFWVTVSSPLNRLI